MNNYSDLFNQVKSNSRRIEKIDKQKKLQSDYHSGYCSPKKMETEENDGFSIRMIAVMFVLVITMFLKQSGVFDDNAVYEAVMAEIHRQTTIEEIEHAVEENAVQPVMKKITKIIELP